MYMVSETVSNSMQPINDFIFQSLPYLALALLIVVALVMLRKLIDAVTYKRHKHDACGSTNKWWDWKEFEENEKKNKKDS